jgi:hypothetical protein
MKQTFRKQMLEQLLNEANESPTPRRDEAKPVNEAAIRSLCDFVFANPVTLDCLGSLVKEQLALSVVACASEQQLISVVSFLVLEQIRKKTELGESGSILRGSSLAEVLLGRFLNSAGAQYLTELLRRVGSKETLDVEAMCRKVFECIVSTIIQVPLGIRVVMAALRTACDAAKVAYGPLVGGCILLRLFVPGIIACNLAGKDTTLVASLLLKISSGKLFSDGEENAKFNKFLVSLSFEEYFNEVSAPVTYVGSSSLRGESKDLLLFAQIYFAYFSRLRLDDVVMELLSEKLSAVGNPFLNVDARYGSAGSTPQERLLDARRLLPQFVSQLERSVCFCCCCLQLCKR